MRWLTGVWRAAKVIALILRGHWRIRRDLQSATAEQRGQAVVQWSRDMLQALGVDLRQHGQAPARGPLLIVCNHVTWLDILVLHACGHARFVSKSEVHHWPLIGTMAAAAGTLFIERSSRRDAMRVVHHMVEVLHAGDVLAIFPEGTTSDGLGLLPFHANLIQAALSAPAPVLPAALRYVDAHSGQTSQAVSFVGDESLVDSVWRTVCARGLQVHLAWGEPQTDDGRDRRAWARDLQQQVHALWQGLGGAARTDQTNQPL
jgi:1-acyl-sn-glycerol-3-phosphate acyltransferase